MYILIIFLVFVVIEPLGYAIARKKGLKEAKEWKRVIPFCWIFA